MIPILERKNRYLYLIQNRAAAPHATTGGTTKQGHGQQNHHTIFYLIFWAKSVSPVNKKKQVSTPFYE